MLIIGGGEPIIIYGIYEIYIDERLILSDYFIRISCFIRSISIYASTLYFDPETRSY
jgi:hypothetical protein